MKRRPTDLFTYLTGGLPRPQGFMHGARGFIASYCPVTAIPRYVALVILLVSILAVAPLTLFEFGGDIMFQFVGMKCFASQFWSGDLYPRWCFDANAGLGAPVFVYYPPLGFYVAALLYPLTGLGLSIEGVYLLCLLSASVVTGLTAWSWFRDLTSEKKALLAALIFLWLPYRMEVMMFRAAYGELWCIAFMPLVCKYMRRMVLGERAAIVRLALALALCFLSNMPAATIGVMLCGGYVLLMTRGRQWQVVMRFVCALSWAAAMAAAYLGPAILYKPFITTEGVISGQRSWSNDFLTIANVTKNGQGHVVVAIALMLMAALGLAVYIASQWRKLQDETVKQELLSWGIIALVACFMLFPLSQPVWNLLGFISMLAFPWRMQLAIMLASAYALVIVLDKLQPNMRKGDMALGFFMLALVSLFVISARTPDFVTYGDKIIASQFITQREYRTVWTDKDSIALPYILEKQRSKLSVPRVQLINGDAHGEPLDWQNGRVELSLNALRPSTVRLELSYFPMWQMTAEPENAAIQMTPEPHSGQVLLSTPAGRYHIEILPRISALSPWKVIFCYILSMVTLVLALFYTRKYR